MTNLDTHQIDVDGIVFKMYESIKGLTHYFLNMSSTVTGRTKTWHVQGGPTYNQRWSEVELWSRAR